MTGLPVHDAIKQGTSTLQTRCTAEIKNRFRALAKGHGLTESMLLRRMIAAVLTQHVDEVLAFSTTRLGVIYSSIIRYAISPTLRAATTR